MAASKQTPGYEQARDELLTIVQQLESGTVPLSESMELWEKGERLATICTEWLAGARAKVAATRRPDADPDQ